MVGNRASTFIASSGRALQPLFTLPSMTEWPMSGGPPWFPISTDLNDTLPKAAALFKDIAWLSPTNKTSGVEVLVRQTAPGPKEKWSNLSQEPSDSLVLNGSTVWSSS